MEDTKEQMTTKEEILFKKFYVEFWPKWRGRVYSQLYRTYHPSTYVESFNSPSSNFEDALEIIEEAVHEGKKLGLLPELDFHYPVLAGKLKILQKEQYVLDWIDSFLLFDVIWDIVHEFRCYCGENGIDPNCEGKCMDEFPPDISGRSMMYTNVNPESGTLKQDYYTLHHYVNEIKERAKGEGLNLDNILPEITNELQYLVPDITVEDVKIKIKKDMPEMWSLLNEQTQKEKNRLHPTVVKSRLLQETLKSIIDNTRLIKEDGKKYNQDVLVGDVIELIHMEDPYSPIPVATKGVVIGFEDMGPMGQKILVSWIMGPDKMSKMPILPDVDVYRISPSMDEFKKREEEGKPLIEQAGIQTIEYEKISPPQKYGNKEYVYFTNTSATKEPQVHTIMLSGPHGDVTLDAIEVKNARYGGIQVNYNNETREILNPILNFRDPTVDCTFTTQVLNSDEWKRGGRLRNNTFGAIQGALQEIYRENMAGPGEPTSRHIPKGFINIPGTEAAGTNHGWSIINFFNTNPVVRRILVTEYENYVNSNKLPCRFDIDEFTDWIEDNKYEIFGGGKELFDRLVKANQSTWANGQRNELAVLPHLKKFYGNNWNVVWDGEPGILRDALIGVDMAIVNNESGEEHTYQAKPLSKVEERDGRWIVNSGWLHRYNPDQVSHYIFGPSPSGKIIIFKNEGQEPQSGGNVIIFDYPPMG